MCPSFRVTREEMHSTRGRAHLLFEMLKGDPLTGGWQDEHVKEALDLCLACKGCKGECPVSVDMATYKSEFLSHYYEQHRRPITAYAFGLIHWWARLGVDRARRRSTRSRTRRACARSRSSPPGMPQQRDVPAFAPQTFQQWFRAAAAPGHRRPAAGDPLARHVQQPLPPATRRSPPCDVLERAGFHVDVPAAAAVLRPAAVRLRHARIGEDAGCATSSTRSDRRSGRAFRSSASSRAASRCSATR